MILAPNGRHLRVQHTYGWERRLLLLVVLGEALLEYRAPPPPPRLRAAAGQSLPQPLPLPCWIKKDETSPGCTCVEHGGTVRSALDRIFCDLNRREYDSIRVLVMLPLNDLQGYEDALPSLSLLVTP